MHGKCPSSRHCSEISLATSIMFELLCYVPGLRFRPPSFFFWFIIFSFLHQRCVFFFFFFFFPLLFIPRHLGVRVSRAQRHLGSETRFTTESTILIMQSMVCNWTSRTSFCASGFPFPLSLFSSACGRYVLRRVHTYVCGYSSRPPLYQPRGDLSVGGIEIFLDWVWKSFFFFFLLFFFFLSFFLFPLQLGVGVKALDSSNR